jgi:hypothetical protein
MFKIYVEKRPLDFSGPEDPFYLAPRTIPLHDSVRVLVCRSFNSIYCTPSEVVCSLMSPHLKNNNVDFETKIVVSLREYCGCERSDT